MSRGRGDTAEETNQGIEGETTKGEDVATLEAEGTGAGHRSQEETEIEEIEMMEGVMIIQLKRTKKKNTCILISSRSSNRERRRMVLSGMGSSGFRRPRSSLKTSKRPWKTPRTTLTWSRQRMNSRRLP